MQNSTAEGTTFEDPTTSYSGEVAPPNDVPTPGFNTEATARYDEVFPAMPSPAYVPPSAPSAWNNKMRVGSSNVNQVFVISRNERKFDNSENFGESESKTACSVIMDQTNTKIEIFAGKDQALTFVVDGKCADVMEAKRRIIAHFQTPASTTVNIPKDYHKNLLGKGGQKLKDLEKATSCKISVPNINDSSDVISVTGPRDGVEKAIHIIKVTYDELSKQANERVQVPKIYHPFICGGHNENVNKLAADNNVKIHVPPPSVQNDEITIAGEKEGVVKVKERILEIYHEMEQKCNHVSVEVPKTQHKYIIGPKGSSIAEILQATGVSVEMPATDVNSETVTLRGPTDKLGPALTMVYAKANSVSTNTVHAPGWLHKRLRGKKGANIRRIVQDSRIHVEFKEDQDSIRIEGPTEEVSKVKEELEKETAEYLATLVYDELKVDARFSKHIIGKGGANVNRLKDESGVDINISEEQGIATLKIEGTPDGVKKVKADLQEMVAKMENEKEKDVVIEQRFIPSMIGQKGEKIKEIRDKFNQVQIIFPNQAVKSDVVKIRGPKDDVEQCAKHLKKLVKDLEHENFTMEVPIFKPFHKYIVGKGGVNIRKIRNETNTKIDLPSEGETSDVIWITGREERVLQAKERILKIQSEMANIVEEEITIPPKHYNSLIGPGGKLIHSIEECTGVQIKFPDQNSKSDKVIVRGPKEDVQRAIQQLEELSNEREASSFSAEVKANPQHLKYLIGKNGVTVKRIRSNTGAHIVFPSDKDPDAETIVIMGKQEQVAAAKKELEQMIADIGNTVEDEMVVDPQYHKHFTMRRGAVINQISDECGGVTISFPRATVSSDKVTLKGSRECIDLAKKRIEETVKELESMVTIDCIIPQRHHRAVMGHRGTKVQNITADYNVQIRFPDREDPDAIVDGALLNGESNEVRPGDIIKITGIQEKCEQAKEALLALIPITIEVPVAFELHRSIIGRSGDKVRSLMEKYDVRIAMSPADQHIDIIKISGALACVEAAREALFERVKELEKEKEERALKSFQIQVEIDPEYHPKIIGRKGLVITKIRDDYGVVINLPKRGDAEEHIITITGYEDKAIAARDHILSIVNELKDRIKEEIEVDSRVHSRLIGPRHRTIRKIMDEFGVDVKFPRPTDPNPDLIIITGATEESVLDAKEELLNQAEEHLQDMADNYTPPAPSRRNDIGRGPTEGFVVSGAPWETGPQQTPDTASIADFPTFGSSGQGPQLTTWGPRR